MAAFGRIDEFNADGEDWAQYTERLQQYFIANDIEDAGKQQTILLSVCGAKTYGLIRSLVSPAKSSEKTFAELCEIVQKHHHPKPSAIVQRVKFASLFRKPDQSISTFMAECCRVAEDCEFGASLDEMLRDRLIISVGDYRIQRRLLSETDIQYKKCMAIAQGMEVAAKNTSQMNSMNSQSNPSVAKLKEEKVNKVSNNQQGKQQQRRQGQRSSQRRSHNNCEREQSGKFPRCYRCTSTYHSPDDCRYKLAECHACHVKGHIAKACKAKKWQRTKNSANVVEDSIDNDHTYTMFNVNSTEAKKAKALTATFSVNGKILDMQIDTGASVSLVSFQTYKQVLSDSSTLQKSGTVLRTYTGEQIKVVGTVNVNVQYKTQSATMKLIVVRGSGPSLVGRDWLKEIKLNWSEICQFVE